MWNVGKLTRFGWKEVKSQRIGENQAYLINDNYGNILIDDTKISGDDSKNPSQYHPFYITDSSEGGYGQKSESERSKQIVYAGVGYDTSGYPFPKAGKVKKY